VKNRHPIEHAFLRRASGEPSGFEICGLGSTRASLPLAIESHRSPPRRLSTSLSQVIHRAQGELIARRVRAAERAIHFSEFICTGNELLILHDSRKRAPARAAARNRQINLPYNLADLCSFAQVSNAFEDFVTSSARTLRLPCLPRRRPITWRYRAACRAGEGGGGREGVRGGREVGACDTHYARNV